MYRVLVTARSFASLDEKPKKILEENGFEVIKSPIDGPLKEKDFLEVVQGQEFHALLVGGDQVTAKVLEGTKELKVVSMHGAGLDKIDTEKAKELGIPVLNAAGLNAPAVAELTLALMFALARKMIPAYRSVCEGRWDRFMGNSLEGKKLALIGFGNIGRKVGQLAQGIGMEVLAYDIAKPEDSGGVEFVSMGTCFREGDFISLHAPLTAETKNLVKKGKLEMMKKTAFLVNTSRGGLIDEEALFQALKERTIAGAGLDVLKEEPPQKDNPLLNLDNCIVTPHMGARTYDVVKAVSLIAAENIIKTLK